LRSWLHTITQTITHFDTNPTLSQHQCITTKPRE